VGDGIGGVAAAVALRQVGSDALIYERSPQVGEVGAGPRVVTGLLPARLFEYNLRRVYYYEV
jgi:predicted NAD/FAD-dependent oxidoreductase